MFRLPFAALAIIACASVLSAADPGPSGPIFRRPSVAPAKPATPPAPAEKLDVPRSFTPPAEALKEVVSKEKIEGAEVDVAEVLRRRDHVTRAGRGPMASADRAIGDALAPPPDDSAKWFITVIVERGAKESDCLLYDLKHSPELRAWANPDEPVGSWAHLNVYDKDDKTQDFRWKNLKIPGYPVMLLQPPAKLADESIRDSWIWGDPSTVVAQWSGYDATAPDRAKLRAVALGEMVDKYSVAIAARRNQLAGPGPRSKVDRPTPGMKQAAKPSDNTGAPPYPQTITIPGVNPVSADPTVPSGSGQLPTGSLDLLGQLIKRTITDPTIWLAVLVGLKIFELVAARTPTKVDDRIAAFFRGVVDQSQSPTKPTT